MISEILNKLLQSQVGFPFDLHKVEIDVETPLLTQLNEAYTCIDKTYLQDEKQIRSVWKGCIFLLEIAPLYDYNSETHANGYWSFAKLIIKFGKILQITANEDVYSREQVVNVLQVSNLSKQYL